MISIDIQYIKIFNVDKFSTEQTKYDKAVAEIIVLHQPLKFCIDHKTLIITLLEIVWFEFGVAVEWHPHLFVIIGKMHNFNWTEREFAVLHPNTPPSCNRTLQ